MYRGYSFDDVLLLPKLSTISSRDNISTKTYLGKDVYLSIPIMSANMPAVTGTKLAVELAKLGGLPVLHRFYKTDNELDYSQIEDNYNFITQNIPSTSFVAISLGVKEIDKQFLYGHANVFPIICIDVAHGHHSLVKDMILFIKEQSPESLIIAGNVATAPGAEYLAEAGADVVKCGIGPGCFAAGTRILMSNGFYKNIEDVKPGDRIINRDGQPKTVLKSFSSGVKNVSKIRNSIFYKDTFATSDHQYLIGDLSSISKKTLESMGYAKTLNVQSKTIPKKSKIKWQEIGKSTDVAFLMPKNINFELPEYFKENIIIRDGGDDGINIIKNKVDFILEPTFSVGYMFGTFLGDGCAHLSNNGKTDIGSVHWYFGLNEQHIVDKLNVCVKTITGRDLYVKATDNTLECSLYHKPLAEFLFTFGKRKEKHLPAKLLVDNKDYLNGLFQGLIDSDGCVESNGRQNFVNTSQSLIELFNVITYLLTGVFPNNQKKKTTTGNLKNANIDNFNQAYSAKVNLTAEKRLIDKYQVSKLLEYTKTDDSVEVFDLTIDCDTHSFIADNAIVHNSVCSTRSQTGNGVPQLTALQLASTVLDKYGTKLISDGGITKAGDIVKALCFADAVMIGKMFAQTYEAPYPGQYFGNSTLKNDYVEGAVIKVSPRVTVKDLVKSLMDGLRSGMSYQGVDNLYDLKMNPQFIEISNAGLIESSVRLSDV